MPAETDPQRTVVLVEDDLAVRLSLAFTLELEGFSVVALDSGEALLACDLPVSSACLVLDQHMGGLTGLQALAELRERGIGLPSFLITSHPTQATRARAEALQARIIEKPLLGDVLVAALREATPA
jgi:FixJ family two-component response regulator